MGNYIYINIDVVKNLTVNMGIWVYNLDMLTLIIYYGLLILCKAVINFCVASASAIFHFTMD